MFVTVSAGILLLLSSSWVGTRGAEELEPGHLPVGSPPPDPELILSLEEKLAFGEVAVHPNITAFPDWEKYIGSDLFLLRWIRAKGLNVNLATSDMFQFLRFLRRERATKLMTEELPDIAADFPVHLTQDRGGRPVLYWNMADWNIRAGILQGKRPRMIRQTYKVVLQLLRRVTELGWEQPNITQAWTLMNMDGFNVLQHGCPACISYYFPLLELYERYVPGLMKEVIIINAPLPFRQLLLVLRPVLSLETRRNLRVFGTNRNVWKPYLEEKIGTNHLPREFGGERNQI